MDIYIHIYYLYFIYIYNIYICVYTNLYIMTDSDSYLTSTIWLDIRQNEQFIESMIEWYHSQC